MRLTSILASISYLTLTTAQNPLLPQACLPSSRPSFRHVCEAPSPGTEPSVASAWGPPQFCRPVTRSTRQSIGEAPNTDEDPEDVCTYVNPLFGNGAVTITTPTHQSIIQEYTSAPAKRIGPKPYHEAQIPGKGRGFVANRKIARGEILGIHPATLVVQAQVHTKLDPKVRDFLYGNALSLLPETRRLEYMTQMGESLFDKLDTNAFDIYTHSQGTPEMTTHLGAFPEVSGYNHDCRPSVLYRIHGMTHTSVAARDILEGEELSVSYIDITFSFKERQEKLAGWNFTCSCAQCSKSVTEREISDKRLARIHELSDLMDRADISMTASTGAELARLYEEEELYINLSNAYTRAALNYALFAKEEESRIFARKAIDALIVEKGMEGGDVNPMMELEANPKEHWAWDKWKFRIQMEERRKRQREAAQEG